MKNKVYISGKITGLDYEVAKSNFKKAQEKLINEGFIVLNPMELEHNHDLSWENYMRIDLIAMLDCTHIYMLNGWGNSRGAYIELTLAKDLNFNIIFENEK